MVASRNHPRGSIFSAPFDILRNGKSSFSRCFFFVAVMVPTIDQPYVSYMYFASLIVVQKLSVNRTRPRARSITAFLHSQTHRPSVDPSVSSFFPKQILKESITPVCAQHRQNTLIPCCIGLSGRYCCIKLNTRPMYVIILSSIVTYCPATHEAAAGPCQTPLSTDDTLKRGSFPRTPLAFFLQLSQKCTYVPPHKCKRITRHDIPQLRYVQTVSAFTVQTHSGRFV